MNLEFATARRIVFGPGRLRELPGLVQGLGSRAALVTGRNSQRAAPVFQLLENSGLHPETLAVAGEPTTGRVAEMARDARAAGCNLVVAFGGGSAIDAGKALAALLANPGDPLDYLEVVGKGRPLARHPVPCVAIPTTAGTGAEATRNAVLLVPERGVKVSMRHPAMLPALALVDPELTLSMPPRITASTGLDAFVQLLEAFVSAKSNPLADGFCREGLSRAARALPRAFADGDDLQAREEMALASLLGGMALANAGLGAVHGFAGPIGGMFGAPHGLVCAALLPAVVRANIQALEGRKGGTAALEKYQEAFRIVTGNPNAGIGEGIRWIDALCANLGVPSLGAFGIGEADFPEIVEKASRASSMKGNPVRLTETELSDILARAL